MHINKLKYHRILIKYFDSQFYFQESLQEQQKRAKQLPPTSRPVNVRKVIELPWQRFEVAHISGIWDDIEQLFSDLFFLEAKTEAGMVFNLADDIRRASVNLPEERPLRSILFLLEEAIRKEIHFLARHPTTLFQHLWNSCWWYQSQEIIKSDFAPNNEDLHANNSGADSPLQMLIEKWGNNKLQLQVGFPMLRSLRPPSQSLGTGLKLVIGGDNTVKLTALSPDGKSIVSGNDSGIVCIWDTESGKKEHEFQNQGPFDSSLEGMDREVNNVVFFSDSRRVAVGYNNGVLNVFDAREGTRILTITTNKYHCSVESLAISHDCTIIAIKAMGSIRLMSSSSGKVLMEMYEHEGDVNGLAFSPNDHYLAVASSDETLRIWTVPDCQEVSRCTFGSNRDKMVNTVAIAPNGESIAVGLSDGTLGVFSFPALDKGMGIIAHTKRVNSVAFSPDSKLIVSGGADKKVRIWEAASGKHLTTLAHHAGWVWSVSFSSDGDSVLSSGDGKGVLSGYNINEKPNIEPSNRDFGEIREVIVSSDGNLVASRFKEDRIEIVNFRKGIIENITVGSPGDTEYSITPGRESKVKGFGFLNDCQHLFVLTAKEIKIYDLNASLRQSVLECHNGSLIGAEPLPLNPILIAWYLSGKVRLWSLDDTDPIHVLDHANNGDEGVRQLTCAPNGSRLVTEGLKNTWLWEPLASRKVTQLNRMGKTCHVLAFTEDSSSLISSTDNELQVWDAITGDLRHAIKTPAFDSAFSNGEIGIIEPSSEYNKLIVYNVWNGDQLGSFERIGFLKEVAFSSDGAVCVLQLSTGIFISDCWVEVWDIRKMKLLTKLRGIADLKAIAAGSYSLVANETETVIMANGFGSPIAWLPEPLFHCTRVGPDNIWAGTRRYSKYVQIVKLEDCNPGQ
jgi:WD40 repeat protein